MEHSTIHTHVGASEGRCQMKSRSKARAALPTDLEAFTRLELLTLLGVCALLFLVIGPLLAQGPQRSQAAVCMNNLRQIGRAIATWNADHGAANPWRVDYAGGGTRNHPSGLQNNLWF